MFPDCCFCHRIYVAQGLVNEYSIRLELTLVRSLNVFPFGCGFYIEVILPFS